MVAVSPLKLFWETCLGPACSSLVQAAETALYTSSADITGAGCAAEILVGVASAVVVAAVVGALVGSWVAGMTWAVGTLFWTAGRVGAQPALIRAKKMMPMKAGCLDILIVTLCLQSTSRILILVKNLIIIIYNIKITPGIRSSMRGPRAFLNL